MARILKLALLVLFVWLSVEFYTNGLNGAFGGLFRQERDVNHRLTQILSTSKRAAGAFQRAYDESENRVDKLLEEKGLSKN